MYQLGCDCADGCISWGVTVQMDVSVGVWLCRWMYQLGCDCADGCISRHAYWILLWILHWF